MPPAALVGVRVCVWVRVGVAVAAAVFLFAFLPVREGVSGAGGEEVVWGDEERAGGGKGGKEKMGLVVLGRVADEEIDGEGTSLWGFLLL